MKTEEFRFRGSGLVGPIRYSTPVVTTRSGKWHPTGRRWLKAETRAFRRMQPLLDAMIAPLFEYHDTFRRPLRQHRGSLMGDFTDGVPATGKSEPVGGKP